MTGETGRESPDEAVGQQRWRRRNRDELHQRARCEPDHEQRGRRRDRDQIDVFDHQHNHRDHDVDGSHRPKGTAWDIGAHELQ